MLRVTQTSVVRLALGLTVEPALYVSEARSRRVFEVLLDEFPQLAAVPLVDQERMAVLLRPARGKRQATPVCQFLGNSVVVGMDMPTRDEIDVFLAFGGRVYELVRQVFHVGRVARAGRVESNSYTLEGEGNVAAEALRTSLTKLSADDALDLSVQFTRRDGPYNINLSLVTGSSEDTGDPTTTLRNVVLAQSDVNNWDQSGDITWEQSEAIWQRGMEHAQQQVPAFLRDRVKLEIGQPQGG
jgi:hypothetical protein